MTGREIDMRAQRVALMEMLAVARTLEKQGDAFLSGHYLHIKERIETVLAITETRADGLAVAESGSEEDVARSTGRASSKEE